MNELNGNPRQYCLPKTWYYEELIEKAGIYADLYNVQTWADHSMHKTVSSAAGFSE